MKTSLVVSLPGALALCLSAYAAAAGVYDARPFGAKGDGVIKETLAIQASIASCAHKSVGTIQLDHGNLVSSEAATATRSAGALVGLPESPIPNLTLTNVSMQSPQGLETGYATVSSDHLDVRPTSGPAIAQLAGATIISRQIKK